MAYRDDWPADRWFAAHATGNPIAPDGTVVGAKPVMCPVEALTAYYRVMHLLTPASARRTIEKHDPALWHSMPYVLAGHGVPEDRLYGVVRTNVRLGYLISYRTPSGFRLTVDGDRVGFYAADENKAWVWPWDGWDPFAGEFPPMKELVAACREHGHIL